MVGNIALDRKHALESPAHKKELSTSPSQIHELLRVSSQKAAVGSEQKYLVCEYCEASYKNSLWHAKALSTDKENLLLPTKSPSTQATEALSTTSITRNNNQLSKHKTMLQLHLVANHEEQSYTVFLGLAHANEEELLRYKNIFSANDSQQTLLFKLISRIRAIPNATEKVRATPVSITVNNLSYKEKVLLNNILTIYLGCELEAYQPSGSNTINIVQFLHQKHLAATTSLLLSIQPNLTANSTSGNIPHTRPSKISLNPVASKDNIIAISSSSPNNSSVTSASSTSTNKDDSLELPSNTSFTENELSTAPITSNCHNSRNTYPHKPEVNLTCNETDSPYIETSAQTSDQSDINIGSPTAFSPYDEANIQTSDESDSDNEANTQTSDESDSDIEIGSPEALPSPRAPSPKEQDLAGPSNLTGLLNKLSTSLSSSNTAFDSLTNARSNKPAPAKLTIAINSQQATINDLITVLQKVISENTPSPMTSESTTSNESINFLEISEEHREILLQIYRDGSCDGIYSKPYLPLNFSEKGKLTFSSSSIRLKFETVEEDKYDAISAKFDERPTRMYFYALDALKILDSSLVTPPEACGNILNEDELAKFLSQHNDYLKIKAIEKQLTIFIGIRAANEALLKLKKQKVRVTEIIQEMHNSDSYKWQIKKLNQRRSLSFLLRTIYIALNTHKDRFIHNTSITRQAFPIIQPSIGDNKICINVQSNIIDTALVTDFLTEVQKLPVLDENSLYLPCVLPINTITGETQSTNFTEKYIQAKLVVIVVNKGDAYNWDAMMTTSRHGNIKRTLKHQRSLIEKVLCFFNTDYPLSELSIEEKAANLDLETRKNYQEQWGYTLGYKLGVSLLRGSSNDLTLKKIYKVMDYKSLVMMSNYITNPLSINSIKNQYSKNWLSFLWEAIPTRHIEEIDHFINTWTLPPEPKSAARPVEDEVSMMNQQLLERIKAIQVMSTLSSSRKKMEENSNKQSANPMPNRKRTTEAPCEPNSKKQAIMPLIPKEKMAATTIDD